MQKKYSNSYQFIHFLTCCLFLFKQLVVLLISILYWLKFNHDIQFSCFFLKSLFCNSRHGIHPCLITSLRKNKSFCRSLKKNNVILHIVYKSLEKQIPSSNHMQYNISHLSFKINFDCIV